MHVTDIHQAVAQGLNVDPQKLRAALGDEEAWAREYELSWLDESTAWLPYALIEAVEDPGAGQPEAYTGGPCYVGVDIGRKHDLWAAVALEQVGDTLWLRELVTLKGKSFAQQDAELDRIMESYDARRVCMDETGMGAKPVEDAKIRHGRLRVEGVMFTGPSKHHLATLARRAFEEKKLRIPPDAALRRDLARLRKSVSPTGAPRFDAATGPEGHSDRAWALFLALHAASGDGAAIEYISSKRLRAADGAMWGMGDISEPVMDSGFGKIPGGYRLEDY